MYEELIKNFIVEKKILIADTSVGVRSGIAKIMKEMGAKTSNIFLAQNYASALDEMDQCQPHIIVTDYNLGNQCGLKLLHLQKRESYSPGECLFFLITANSGETTVAEAAEEDVDSFILKPFTLAFFKERFQAAALAKIRPSGYQKALTEGKDLLNAKHYDEAVDAFTKAMTLFDTPTLALYYQGHTNALRMDPVQAEQSYRSGLSYNQKHYRCLMGISDLLFHTQKYEEAYKYAKVIAETFPLSPQMLVTVLRLAVKNQIFDDIDFLYNIYFHMDFRTPELVKCMKSALLVSGTFRLRRSGVEPALDLFRKTLVTSGRNPIVCGEIVDVLLRHKFSAEADRFLAEFPPEARGGILYQVLKLRIQDTQDEPGKIINEARKMLADGNHDPHVYKILIGRSVDCRFFDSAENLVVEAGKRWPELKDEFNGLLKKDKV